MAVLKTTFNSWSIKADSAEKSAQDQVVMVAELNTHPQLFLDIKVKALFGTLRSGMGVLNVEELESLEHPARQQPHLPWRSHGNILKAGIRWNLFLSRTFITPLLPPADTKVNIAQEGTYKIVCMLNITNIYQQESGEHMSEWNLKVLDRWGQGKIQSWIGHNLRTWWTSPGCLAKTPWANPNSWLVWFLECWICWWPTENTMEMPELLAQHQGRGQTPPDGKLLKWT